MPGWLDELDDLDEMDESSEDDRNSDAVREVLGFTAKDIFDEVQNGE